MPNFDQILGTKTHKGRSKPHLIAFGGNLVCLIQSLIAIVIILPIRHSLAQTSTEALKTTRSDVRAAGARYKAGGFKKLILGGHYRDEWATPVEIPILDLSQSAGGLTAIKKTGGGQSKSLIFRGVDGSRFMFRSVDKDPSQALPEKLRGTILADAVQDGISTAHPYGALVVPPLAEAVGVLHTNPKLVVLPDDERLGPFREEFAGVIGTIEEFVIHGPNATAGFAGFKRIIGTDDLLKELEVKFR